MNQNAPNIREDVPFCITISVMGDPPNKQQKAYKRKVATLRKELKIAKKEILKSKLLSSDISIKVELFTQKIRYVRKGHDNTYIGDLDNIVSGICDELEGLIIKEDCQIKKIHAIKKNIENDADTMFKIHIKCCNELYLV